MGSRVGVAIGAVGKSLVYVPAWVSGSKVGDNMLNLCACLVKFEAKAQRAREKILLTGSHPVLLSLISPLADRFAEAPQPPSSSSAACDRT